MREFKYLITSKGKRRDVSDHVNATEYKLQGDFISFKNNENNEAKVIRSSFVKMIQLQEELKLTEETYADMRVFKITLTSYEEFLIAAKDYFLENNFTHFKLKNLLLASVNCRDILSIDRLDGLVSFVRRTYKNYYLVDFSNINEEKYERPKWMKQKINQLKDLKN